MNSRNQEAKILSVAEPTYINSAKELKVYQLAFAVSVELHRFTLELPKIEQYALGDQLRRTSKSICANLAEGFDRQQQSKAEFKRFLIMASSSCSEILVWLDYCLELGYCDSQKHLQWMETYTQIYRMLHKLRMKAE